jgi:hypothetical protein
VIGTRSICLGLAAALFASVAGPVAPAQAKARPPYRLFDSKRGFTAWTSPRYRQVPTSPGEKIVVGKFFERGRRKESKRSRNLKFRPTYFYVILNDSARARNQKPKETGKDKDNRGRTLPGGVTIPQLALPKSPEEYLKRYIGRSMTYEEKKPRRSTVDDCPVKEYQLESRQGSSLKGVAVFFERDGVWAGFVGVTEEDEFRKDGRLFRKLGYTIRFKSTSDGARRRAATHTDPYEGSSLRGIAYRRKIRRAMVKGWRAIDTPNFIIIHHSSDQRLLRRLDDNLEAMHAYYAELFPSPNQIEAVSTVRVCRNFEEYVQYGGPPRSAGFWNYRSEELVLYDAKKGDYGSRLGNKDTFIVLYHEAFHQYVFHSAGQLNPHIWFNEGNADYFSGAVLGRKNNVIRVSRVRPHPWRVETIQKAVRAGKHAPLKRLFRMSKADYYRNGSLHYAQGWSVVYFLRTSPVVHKNPDWNKILSTYYKVLCREYLRHTADLDDSAALERAQAAEKARSAAHRAAFKGVDVESLEAEWKKFVLRLRAPRR